MSYVDEITLTESSSNKCEVEYVKFRESIANPCNELYDKGYICFVWQYSWNIKI